MTLVEQAAALLADKRRTHGGPTGLTTENEAGAYAAEQFAMWLCLNGERLVDALVEAERDAERYQELRRLWRCLVSGPADYPLPNPIGGTAFWERCDAIHDARSPTELDAAIDTAKGKP